MSNSPLGFSVMLMLMVFGAFFAVLTERYKCKLKAEEIGEYKYDIYVGCLVKPKGEDMFIPLENYRYTKN